MVAYGIGARNPVVKSLQRKLKSLGYEPLDVDGIYGKATAGAIRRFQKDRNLKVDGIAGPEVLNALGINSASPEQGRRSHVFISYSHNDLRWLKRLQVHLKPLEQLGTITRWDDTLIKPGSKWQEEINKGLKLAKVAVLLISADFLASDFITTNELPKLLAGAEKEGVVVLPVILSSCRFDETPSLSQFQSINSALKPLGRMTRDRQEELFVVLSREIEKALKS